MNSSIFVSPQKANPVEIIQIMDIFVIVFSALAVLIAGIIRGYSGFGFSIIATTSMTLVLPPVDVIPVVLVLEILASAWLLPRVWKQIDWKSLSWLSAGVLIGTPPGVYLLAHVPARPMRAGIALSIMVLVVLLWRGFHLKKMPARTRTAATGLVSGLLNGSAAIGGPPVILFYFSSPAGATVSRASIIAYFLGTDSLVWVLSLAHGLVTIKTGILSGILCAPLLLGIFLGNRFFSHSKEGAFKRKVLILSWPIQHLAGYGRSTPMQSFLHLWAMASLRVCITHCRGSARHECSTTS